jgi:hemoglobin
MTKLLLPLAALCAALALPAARAQSGEAAAPAASAPVDDSLFLALGGRPGIDRIVGEFVPRLMSDARTKEFFKHAQRDHFQQMLEEKFCEVSGGGCAYTGVDLKRAHADMDISRGDFNAVVEVLQDAMNAQGVPFATQNRLLARLAPFHRDIVH